MCERLFLDVVVKECINCKQEKDHHAKGLCYTCYKKLRWKPKEASCKRCKRTLPIHAKGLCAGCYNYMFHSEANKLYARRKNINIDLKTFKRVTKECIICGFDKVVDFYHIDKNKSNNSSKNVVGLCPNHHRMANNVRFRDEILLYLKNKGFDMPLQKSERLERNLAENETSTQDLEKPSKLKANALVDFSS